MPKRVYIETYGCQMNKLDSELVLGNLLSNQDYVYADTPDGADIILINTCSVRKHAEDRVFSRLGYMRKFLRKNQNLIIGVIGCMAENYQQKIIERFPYVKIVCSPSRLGKIKQLIEEVEKTTTPFVMSMDKEDELPEPIHASEVRSSRYCAYVRVSEGCNFSCSYCIVPFVRGRERSIAPEIILEEVKKLVDEGVKEVTMLGQTVDSYGLTLSPPTNLASLLEKVSRINGLERIRFVTSHPVYFTKTLIEAVKCLPKVCKYIHMPVQSGSNRILALMKRGYTVERYKDIVYQIREAIPGVGISSDFIVGFPSETSEDFEMSRKLLEEMRFQNCFIFKYSPRPRTSAYELGDDVPLAEKKRRNQILLKLQSEISYQENQQYVGKEVEILVEGKSKTDPARQMGRTTTNQIVIFEDQEDLSGQIIKRTITRATSISLYA